MGRLIQTCYISAPAGAQLDVLRSALERRAIRVLVPNDFGGEELQTSLQSVARADLVIGILTSERRSQWVLFEIGQAAARNCPILLIGPEKADLPPSHLKSLIYLRVSLRNREAIEFALDQLLASPVPTAHGRPDMHRSNALGAQVDGLLGELQAAVTERDGQRLEKLCADVIRRSGAEVVSEREGPDYGADLAVWSDELQPLIGNPLLVEIKLGGQSNRVVEEAAKSFSRVITKAGSTWGLLLLGENPSSALGRLPPTVLACSVESLIDRMRNQSFSEVVRDLRNRRVHGGSL